MLLKVYIIKILPFVKEVFSDAFHVTNGQVVRCVRMSLVCGFPNQKKDYGSVIREEKHMWLQRNVTKNANCWSILNSYTCNWEEEEEDEQQSLKQRQQWVWNVNFIFHNLDMRVRVACPLPYSMFFPLVSYAQCSHHSWVCYGARASSKDISALAMIELEPLTFLLNIQ